MVIVAIPLAIKQTSSGGVGFSFAIIVLIRRSGYVVYFCLVDATRGVPVVFRKVRHVPFYPPSPPALPLPSALSTNSVEVIDSISPLTPAFLGTPYKKPFVAPWFTKPLPPWLGMRQT